MNNQILVSAYSITLFLLSVYLVRKYCRYAINRGIVDFPNARSSHTDPVPRGAGIVFAGLWSLSVILGSLFNIFSKEILILLPATLLISLIGYWDDRKNLSARRRLFVQCVVSIVCVHFLGAIESIDFFNLKIIHLGWIGAVLTLFGIMWSINLFNFMDGIDGISSVETFFVLGVGGLICWRQGATEVALLAWAMVIAVGGFLVWNWPKASVFMGDVGSYCLGFVIAMCAIVADVRYQIPITIWFILYGVFWFDATVTLCRRLWLKKHWATAHRDHAFQRLHRAGFSHQQILWGIIGVNTLLALIAYWAVLHPNYLGHCLVGVTVLLLLIYLGIEALFPIKKGSEE